MANLASVIKQSCMASGTGILIDNETLHFIQQKLLTVMDDIIEVCEENHIDYQLSGGTALGAVRHHGFIPWDDDIDLNMRRSELERFLPIFKKKYKDKYWINVLGETENYDYMMVHIMTKDVRARALMEPPTQNCGLCIDIFPIENTYDNALLRHIHGYGCMGFRYVLSCLRFLNNREEVEIFSKVNSEFASYAKKRLKFAKFVSFIPPEKWYKWSASWLKRCKNENSKYVVIPSGQHQFFREMYERAKFCVSQKISFEGRQINITKDYDNYLKILYHDYMAIPPVEKREKHVLMELDINALRNHKNSEVSL